MFYQTEGSFLNIGGYVENIDIHDLSKLETSNKLRSLKDQNFINF